MLEQVRHAPGTLLDRGAYHADFAREFARLTGVLWKLERGQNYREDGDASWEAFMAGDWPRALALNSEERAAARAEAAALAEQGAEIRRLRIVERPITPYVQWQMHYLHLLAEEGFPQRVLDAAVLAERERQAPLPDVVLLGGRVLYRVVQDSDHTPAGARRIDDPALIQSVRRDLVPLFDRAERLSAFFHRDIAPMPAPTPQR